MNYEVHEKELPSQHVISERRRTSLAELGETFSAELEHLLARVTPLGGIPSGAPFVIYHNQPFKPDDVDVEVGVPVTSVRPISGEHDLPGAHVAYTIHTGSYGGIGAAYAELYRWIGRMGKRPVGPPRELYIVGPRHTDRPEAYVTEVEIPIR